MTVQEAKEIVVLAGKRLVESGLIARTWGNVSCRISSSHFVITPSGRDYLSLTPEEIVEVAISDCSYSGDIKPSSEKGVHAEVYKLHSDINFVIHTHQDHASAVSVLDLDTVKVADQYTSLQGEVILAGYGLPGTKTLRSNVADALVRSKGKAVIMKNHGALCYGTNYEEAFLVANELENACENFIRDKFLKSLNKTVMEDPIKMGCLALSQITKRAISTTIDTRIPSYESERTKTGFTLKANDKTYDIAMDRYHNALPPDNDLILEVQIHNKIYQSRLDINHIIHAVSPGIVAVSCADMNMKPLLDDFAQIAGTSVKTVKRDAESIAHGLKGSPVIFLQNNGALCCGGTKGDAQAVSIVTEKNSNALICAALFRKVKYIKKFECMLMRFVYLKKYSKQVNKK